MSSVISSSAALAFSSSVGSFFFFLRFLGLSSPRWRPLKEMGIAASTRREKSESFSPGRRVKGFDGSVGSGSVVVDVVVGAVVVEVESFKSERLRFLEDVDVDLDFGSSRPLGRLPLAA